MRCSRRGTCRVSEGGRVEKFRAYRLTEADKRIRAEFVDCTLDELDAGDVVVRVAYSSVNYKDALAATGKGRILRRPTCIGGIDFSGGGGSSSDPQVFKRGGLVGGGYDFWVSPPVGPRQNTPGTGGLRGLPP